MSSCCDLTDQALDLYLAERVMGYGDELLQRCASSIGHGSFYWAPTQNRYHIMAVLKRYHERFGMAPFFKQLIYLLNDAPDRFPDLTKSLTLVLFSTPRQQAEAIWLTLKDE